MSDSTVEMRNHVDIPPISDVAGFARREKRHRGGGSLSRIKSSLEKARSKKGQKRMTVLSKEMVDKHRTQRVLFDAPAMPTPIHSSHPLEVSSPTINASIIACTDKLSKYMTDNFYLRDTNVSYAGCKWRILRR
ncbi:hypothetical protein H6P81_002927 [Aristolochia fimbriata]|uniref:Uncharacterized protein n=1 Tax=Aristolochia fimbriata TaxID=158543 RepID=A0AAV7FCU6_ARIFI|nr:hypothetical protein H6P81_002927 [Aristolochia fimbriata]